MLNALCYQYSNEFSLSLTSVISTDLTGYRPSSQWKNLTFDGDERTFEIWETKILGYMKLRKLKDTLVGNGEGDQDKNEIAFADFNCFKQALRNFEEMEIIRSSGISKKYSVLKSKEYKKPFTCYNYGIVGHKSAECRRPKQSKYLQKHIKFRSIMSQTK